MEKKTKYSQLEQEGSKWRWQKLPMVLQAGTLGAAYRGGTGGEMQLCGGLGGAESWEADFGYGRCSELYSGEQSGEINSLLTK